jgi:hypothetical protein
MEARANLDQLRVRQTARNRSLVKNVGPDGQSTRDPGRVDDASRARSVRDVKEATMGA